MIQFKNLVISHVRKNPGLSARTIASDLGYSRIVVMDCLKQFESDGAVYRKDKSRWYVGTKPLRANNGGPSIYDRCYQSVGIEATPIEKVAKENGLQRQSAVIACGSLVQDGHLEVVGEGLYRRRTFPLLRRSWV